MIGLVMAGGRGSRMTGKTEKLLLRYKKPVILHVIDALEESKCIQEIVAATSPHAPQTEKIILNAGIRTIRTAGRDYPQDLIEALGALSGTVMVVSGDMPLLDGKIIREIAATYDPTHDWTSILVTEKFADSVGVDCEYTEWCGQVQCAYTGISLVNSDALFLPDGVAEHRMVIDDRRIAFNMNTRREYRLLGVADDRTV